MDMNWVHDPNMLALTISIQIVLDDLPFVHAQGSCQWNLTLANQEGNLLKLN